MPTSTANCTYSLIESRIHQILIHTATRQTIEDLFTIFGEVLVAHPDQEAWYLLDTSDSEELPYRYLLQRTQKWNKDQPNIPPSRIAVIYRMGVLASMLNVLMKQLSSPKSQLQIFSPDQRDEAIQWLQKTGS